VHALLKIDRNTEKRIIKGKYSAIDQNRVSGMVKQGRIWRRPDKGKPMEKISGREEDFS